MPLIDNTQLLSNALRIIGMGTDLIERLERDIVVDSAAKAETLAIIKFVIETQSEAIRRLVEQQVEISDKLDEIMIRHNLA